MARTVEVVRAVRHEVGARRRTGWWRRLVQRVTYKLILRWQLAATDDRRLVWLLRTADDERLREAIWCCDGEMLHRLLGLRLTGPLLRRVLAAAGDETLQALAAMADDAQLERILRVSKVATVHRLLAVATDRALERIQILLAKAAARPSRARHAQSEQRLAIVRAG